MMCLRMLKTESRIREKNHSISSDLPKKIALKVDRKKDIVE